jgi:hypothetical protein
MKQVVILFLPTLCLFGCVSSEVVTTEAQYDEINVLGREKRAGITLMTDAGETRCEGDFVTLGRDSVRWVDPATGSGRSASTGTLRCIRFTMRNGGAVTGALVTLAVGTGLFVVALAGSSGRYSKEPDEYALFGYLGIGIGTVGLPVGAVVGALIGNKTDYVFEQKEILPPAH